MSLYVYTGDGACRSCDAPILWFRTPAGKNIPVNDGAPGLPMMDHGDSFDADDPIVRAILAATHFATCPNASKHRRAKP